MLAHAVKKQYHDAMKKDLLVTTLTVVVVLCLVTVSYALFINLKDEDVDREQTDTDTTTRQEALAEARSYEPASDKMCTTVQTPAVHVESGAEYTFPSGCIPAGWEKTDNRLEQAE